jgi:hypothetical protein
VWNTVNINKYKTFTVATIGGMDHTDIQWFLAGMLPILSILAKEIIYISLSIATMIITIFSVRLGFTYTRKYRSTAFLITLLVCLAACYRAYQPTPTSAPPTATSPPMQTTDVPDTTYHTTHHPAPDINTVSPQVNTAQALRVHSPEISPTTSP